MMYLSLFQDNAAGFMRYAERGWTNYGSQEESREESNQEESNQKEVVIIVQSPEWDHRGRQSPRCISSISRHVYLLIH
jgi:hypothetical protein